METETLSEPPRRNLVGLGREALAAARDNAGRLGVVARAEFAICDFGSALTGSFDLVVSIFGAMFAPKPFDVAKELVRVTKPGGRIVMGNWIPGDPTLVAQILKISSSYSPPPPEGFISPMTWGVEENVIERFAQAGVPSDRIEFSRETYIFEYPAAPTELLAVFRTYYGPTMNAFAAADADGRTEDLQHELAALFTSQNTSQDPDTTSIPATYLQVSVTV